MNEFLVKWQIKQFGNYLTLIDRKLDATCNKMQEIKDMRSSFPFKDMPIVWNYVDPQDRPILTEAVKKYGLAVNICDRLILTNE